MRAMAEHCQAQSWVKTRNGMTIKVGGSQESPAFTWGWNMVRPAGTHVETEALFETLER